MNAVTQYSIVRVVCLLHLVETYNGWHVNKRSPQIGDIGVIVEILHAPDLPDMYVVESVEPDGTTLWLSDFDADEITSVP